MLRLEESTVVYLSQSATDMRKGFRRLSELVTEHFKRSSLDGALYVFVSRDRKKAKILHWESDGYWLCYKRLEASTFRIRIREDGTEEINGVDLLKLLQGMDLRRIQLAKKVTAQVSQRAAA